MRSSEGKDFCLATEPALQQISKGKARHESATGVRSNEQALCTDSVVDEFS